MKARILFLRWSLVVSLTVVGLVIAAVLGWFELMYRLDVTKLSVAILVVFAAATVWCGLLTWRLETGLEVIRGPENRSKLFREVDGNAEHGWFAAGICEKLGLTGTVFGFVIMLIGGFSGFQSTDPAATQQLLERLSTGMSTAFITTLVGVICSILLSIQYHLLARAVERYKP
ncbi:hypothetical protein AMJ57_03685 [Parcubacteria bacterium SG8_24]|nr:MAG: hypothetical protein AMJ57_03685 [Parcubacteria bacterium SG8_24]